MVILSNIYTRGGDQGRTSLGDGTRVPKHAARVAAYGTVDEANAALGLARLHTTGDADTMLARIQNDLFDLGADLCRPGVVVDDGAVRLLVYVPREGLALLATRAAVLATSPSGAPGPSAGARIAPGIVLEDRGRKGSVHRVAGVAS